MFELFCSHSATILQLFCNSFAAILQLFCDSFEAILQIFCSYFEAICQGFGLDLPFFCVFQGFFQGLSGNKLGFHKDFTGKFVGLENQEKPSQTVWQATL